MKIYSETKNFLLNFLNQNPTVVDKTGELRCHRVLYGDGGSMSGTRFKLRENKEGKGDGVRYKTKLERERVFEFFASLNRERNDVGGRILG